MSEILQDWQASQEYPVDPYDVERITFDFSLYLEARGGPDATGLEFVADPPLTIENESLTTSGLASGYFSGWVVDTDYLITARVTAGFLKVSRSVIIKCRSR